MPRLAPHDLLMSELAHRPVASHAVGEDARLAAWMKERNIHPSELRVYDFSGAMKAGVERDPVGGHWPSEFKRDNHPDLIVGGFHTRTGERVKSAPLAKSVQELIDKGWEPATAKRLWANKGN